MRRLLLLFLSACSGGTSIQVSTTQQPSFTYASDSLAIGTATELSVVGKVDSFTCTPAGACGGARWELNHIYFVPLIPEFTVEAHVLTNDGPVTIRRLASAKLPELTYPDHDPIAFEGTEIGICTHTEDIAFDGFQNGITVPVRIDWTDGCRYFVPPKAGTLDIHARVGAYQTDFYTEQRTVTALADVDAIAIRGCTNKTGVGGNTVSLSFRSEATVFGLLGALPASSSHIENAGAGVFVERVSDVGSVENEYRLHGTPSADTEIVAVAGLQKARLHVNALPSCY